MQKSNIINYTDIFQNKSGSITDHTRCSSCKLKLTNDNFSTVLINNVKVICSSICKNCKEKRRLKYNSTNKNCRNKVKIQLIKEMGGKCVCCGLTQWWILTLDHIIPIKGKNREHSYKLYYKLLKDLELRKDFQIMCYGCNSSKNDGEKCTLDHNI